ncbi:hypothetical protein niasHT_017222 [Heterodera trifolii]|uniref:Protein-lysine N-methyltransferase niasHT_017222 n=1 Tax=Heterodera trifolii TaxID=157864 RepID=A0ABD2L3E1_9BILA
MAEADDSDFENSKLGTKEYWDSLYDLELTNFAENTDEGEIWFGRSAELRILKFIEQQNLPISAKICDLGTGNGSLLRKLRSRGFTSLVGLDYSTNAIELAKKQASSCNDHQSMPIEFGVVDLASDQLDNEFCHKFDILIDKGTFDAISLTENRQKSMENYFLNIGKMFSVQKEASQLLHYFLIISCNFTIDELIAHFVKMPSEEAAAADGIFQFVSPLPNAPEAFKFGGSIGTTTNGAVFRWTRNDQ